MTRWSTGSLVRLGQLDNTLVHQQVQDAALDPVMMPRGTPSNSTLTLQQKVVGVPCERRRPLEDNMHLLGL